MQTLSTVLFFVVALLLLASLLMAKRPNPSPARVGVLVLGLGTYFVYEYVSQRAYADFNIRADLLLLVPLFFWSLFANLSTPKSSRGSKAGATQAKAVDSGSKKSEPEK